MLKVLRISIRDHFIVITEIFRKKRVHIRKVGGGEGGGGKKN